MNYKIVYKNGEFVLSTVDFRGGFLFRKVNGERTYEAWDAFGRPCNVSHAEKREINKRARLILEALK